MLSLQVAKTSIIPALCIFIISIFLAHPYGSDTCEWDPCQNTFILIDGLKQNCLKIYFDNKLVKDTFEINDGANTVVYIPSKVRKVTISKGEKKQKINLNLYKYDNEVFKECYNKLNKNVLKIKKNNERYINAFI